MINFTISGQDSVDSWNLDILLWRPRVVSDCIELMEFPTISSLAATNKLYSVCEFSSVSSSSVMHMCIEKQLPSCVWQFLRSVRIALAPVSVVKSGRPSLRLLPYLITCSKFRPHGWQHFDNCSQWQIWHSYRHCILGIDFGPSKSIWLGQVGSKCLRLGQQ